MKHIRSLILALVLSAGLAPGFAQAPPPVPALPDTERRTSYVISASTCACAVGFQLYQDSTDVANWLKVYINGVEIPQSGNWNITSPSGSLSTLPRPITNAVLTFTTARTGTVQIVGAQRPRRLSEYAENRGVAARDLNQAINGIEAQLREMWDRQFRTVQAPPGETLNTLPPLAGRTSMAACFDSGGNLAPCVATTTGSFIAGSGIGFTGSNPTTISYTGATYSAGSGILFTGSNPTVVSFIPPISRPAFGPVASPYPNALGDSLFTNLHVTTALPTLIKNAMGWTSTNTQAVGGASIADQASIYGFQMTPSLVNPAMVWLGTNDVILDGAENRTNEQTSLEGLRALLFHLAIPTAKRVTGQSMIVAAGSWSNMGAAIDPGGTSSATNSSVKRGTVTGRHVVVAGWANLSSNGTAIISIGNSDNSITLFGDTITFKRPAILTNSPGGTPTATVPFVRIYKNVGADDVSKMTISVAVTSATGAGNDVFISYVAGISGSQSEAMPLVMSFNLHNFTAAAEVAQSTSGTRRQRFNRGIANIVDEMVGLGLWIVPVDAASVLWDTTLLGSDGLHPNDAGNTALSAAAVTALNNARAYWEAHNSRLSASAYSDTLSTDLLARGRFVIEDFRRKVVPRTQVGSAFSAHNNGSNTVTVNATDTVLGWSTELYDINGDFASSVWSPPAGLIHIRAGVTFTAGVDQTAYELKIFKNGSFYKRIGRIAASGAAELFIGGELYDLAADGDTYAVYVIQGSGGNATVDGTSTKTYFMGSSAY